MKFEVSIKEVYVTIVSVDADTEEQAKELAAVMLATGELINDGNVAATTYDYTLDKDEWSVWEA